MFDDSSQSEKYPLVLFARGSERFGVAQGEIAAIVDWQKLAPLPHAPDSVMGVAGVHGRMLTVLDVARFGDRGDSISTDEPRKIIALRGDEQLALAADELIQAGDENDVTVLEVKELFPAAIQGRERRRRRF